MPRPQRDRDFGHAHRHAGMAGFRRFDRVHRQRADRVGELRKSEAFAAASHDGGSIRRWKAAGGAETHPAFWQEIEARRGGLLTVFAACESLKLSRPEHLCNNQTFASMRGNDLARSAGALLPAPRGAGLFLRCAVHARSAEHGDAMSARLRQSAGGGGGRLMDGIHLLGEWYGCPADTPEFTRADALRALCLDGRRATPGSRSSAIASTSSSRRASPARCCSPNRISRSTLAGDAAS